jgi:nitrogen fixation NifU-like protein
LDGLEFMHYSDRVLDHFENPRNAGSLDGSDPQVGTGVAGAPSFATVIRLQIKVTADGVIETVRFKAYGSAAVIASSSLITEWVRGKTLAEAEAITRFQIEEALALPPIKTYGAVFAIDAIRAAIGDYRAKQRSNDFKLY